MTEHRGVRAVADTGNTTGVATVVLALLSAGALAGLGLVASNELAPGPAPRVPSDAAAEPIASPLAVVVTPRPGTPTGANPTPAGPQVLGKPTPAPAPAPTAPAAPTLSPVLAGPLLPTLGVLAPVVPVSGGGLPSPGVLTPNARVAPNAPFATQLKATKATRAKAHTLQQARKAAAKAAKMAAKKSSVKKAAKSAKAAKAHKRAPKKVAGKKHT